MGKTSKAEAGMKYLLDRLNAFCCGIEGVVPGLSLQVAAFQTGVKSTCSVSQYFFVRFSFCNLFNYLV